MLFLKISCSAFWRRILSSLKSFLRSSYCFDTRFPNLKTKFVNMGEKRHLCQLSKNEDIWKNVGWKDGCSYVRLPNWCSNASLSVVQIRSWGQIWRFSWLVCLVTTSTAQRGGVMRVSLKTLVGIFTSPFCCGLNVNLSNQSGIKIG